MLRAPYLLAALLCAAAACGGDDDGASPDARGPDAATIDSGSPDANLMPETLFDTGLCVDAACTEIATDARAYAPEYALWSDGAAKRRWIYLPEGAQIDTSDMDHWQFPVGTKLWKEFAVDDGNATTKLETRLLMKIGPDPLDWYRATYAWNEAQDATTLADPSTGAQDVLGTTHDIPSRSDCRKCHDNLEGGVLGFQAILLDHDGEGVTLADLVAEDRLTDPPANSGGAGSEYFPIPGGPEAQAALGYLHVNCGNCHNAGSPVINNVPVEWRLTVASVLGGDVTQTPPYLTAVGVAPTLNTVPGATAIIGPDDAAHSAAYLRMNTNDDAIQMPKLAREEIDPDGVAAVEAWINSL
jgi:hypothetical protein